MEIYNSNKEQLNRFFLELKELESEGFGLANLPSSVFEMMKEKSKRIDEQKLDDLRRELKNENL